MPKSQEILSLRRDQVAAFIQDQTSARTLSDVIRQLNDDLIAGDAAAREQAAQALQHLGFVEYA
ncbi:hypothetical protein [Gymnodinialimonas ulvae]|uniref:hypothetical protein n=1 Tax=Gymnodinialimonas ulvae TaxID=3126504 RepID=UPI0030A855B3